MKKIMKLTAIALCALALCLTSCSKDDNDENTGGKELTKEQFQEAQKKVLNSISGDYKGFISASGKLEWLSGYINWTVDKNDVVVCKNFPYESLAYGISEDDNSDEAVKLRAALKRAQYGPLQFRFIGDQESKNPADLVASPYITTKIKTSQGTYSVVGRLKDNKLKAHYDSKTSKLTMTFVIYKLERIVKILGVHSQYKEEKKFTIPVEFELSTIEKKEIK
ncbi:hypothetical protein [Prevotella fusca]